MASSHTGNKASRHATSMVVAALVCQVACATRDRGAATNPSPQRQASAPAVGEKTEPVDASTGRTADVRPEQPASSKPDARKEGAGPTGSISSPCVLHASESKRRTHRIRLPGGKRLQEEQHGSCSANAECIATHGQDTPGDGFVSLACTERSCTCTLESLQSSRTNTSTSSFEVGSPCATAEQAMQLMVEHCMTGMIILRR